MDVSRYQKFTVRRLHRRDFKGAPYNPRTIDRYARKKLEETMKKDGLLEALVVNLRTMNLVAGHQRIDILDQLEGTDDYSLDCCAIDVDERQEKIINVRLNNPALQGSYDFDKLAVILNETEMAFEQMGFDKMDLELMFDESQLKGMFSVGNAPQEVQDDLNQIGEIKAASKEVTAEMKAEMKQKRKDFIERKREENDSEFYVVVVFQSREHSAVFLSAVEMGEEERYVSGERLLAYLGIGPDKLAQLVEATREVPPDAAVNVTEETQSE